MPMVRDQAVEEIFRSRLSDFVHARTIAADRLRKAGHRHAAAEVARLRKPSPALWAVNQLGHEHPVELDAFLRAVDQLRKAQLGRSRDGVSQAATRQRNALDNLMTLATGVLSNARLAVGPAVLGRISATLLGAAAEKDARERLRRGRLTEEHAAPGFEAFAGMKPRPRQEPSEARREDRDRHCQAAVPRQSRKRQRAAERQARATTARAAKLERDATRLRQRAEKTARAVERRREQLRQAETRLTQQRQAAERAARAVADLQRGVTEVTPSER